MKAHPPGDVMLDLLDSIASGATSVNALVEDTGRAPSSVAECLTRLLRRKYVQRYRWARNRGRYGWKGYRYGLTKSGRRLLERVQ